MKHLATLWNPRSGLALVMVLAVLALMSVLIVSYFSSVNTERGAAQIGASGLFARQVADSAVQLEMSQIREATTSANERTTWASQPGAIRFFSGQIGAKIPLPEGRHAYGYSAGSEDALFKLYSARKLRVTPLEMDADLAEETGVIERWDPFHKTPETDSAYLDFVDLNEPILLPRGGASTRIFEPFYPIFDPRARANAEGEFPADAYGIVEGFDAKILEHPSAQYQPKDMDGQPLPPRPVPYLPMPVRWLYLLKDGTMAPSENGVIRGANKNNPAVSRIAFWSDDETGKLNINTASEGTYWATPLASSRHESGEVDGPSRQIESRYFGVNLSASPPVRNEYQRYPGHPATTSLSPVLGWLWGLPPSDPHFDLNFPKPLGEKVRDFKEAIASLSPYLPIFNDPLLPSFASLPSQIGMGTSRAGTENPDPYTPSESILKMLKKRPVQNIPTRHFYASYEDLMLASERFPRASTPTSATVATLNGKLNPSALERMKGFLSTSSRSSDLNLFSRPRVTIWPVNAEREKRTAYDELFAFTSTVHASGVLPNSRRPFYLTRSNPHDPAEDFVNVPANDGTTPPDQNERMYEYLRWLTGGGGKNAGGMSFIPGFGGNFLSKYPLPAGAPVSDRDQILIGMMDYIRAVNLVDTSVSKPFTPPFFLEGKFPVNHGATAVSRGSESSGQVVPLRNREGTAQGLGRFPMLSEAAMVFYRINVPKPVGTGTVASLQCALFLEMATPMPGYPAIRDTYFTKLTERRRNRMKLGTGNWREIWKSGTLINVPNVASHETCYGRGYLPNLGCTASLLYYDPIHERPTSVDAAMLGKAYSLPRVKAFTNAEEISRDGKYVRGETEKIYPYVSDAIPISGSEFTWSGGSFTLEIWAGEAPDDPRSVLVQTVEFSFPEKEITFPMIPTAGAMEARMKAPVGTEYESRPDSDLLLASRHIVRGVEYTGGSDLPLAQKGDLRVAMTKIFLSEQEYEPREGIHGRYFDGSQPFVHSLQSSHGNPFDGYESNDRGTLAKGGINHGTKPPLLPAKVDGVQMKNGVPGDWTRGLSKFVDGAFGNKVDEGNLFFDYESTFAMLPYFRGRAIEDAGQSYFSPNRQIPSAVVFGSLPSKAQARHPWETLLFRPDRTLAPAGHPGGLPPMDHLFLDLFHLPVIEPYAISEPFSTDGRVNLNYRLMPFGYARGGAGNLPGTRQPRRHIHRDTAMRGVLKAVNVMAVPTHAEDSGHRENFLSSNQQYHWRIALNKTLEAFEERFNDERRGAQGAFRSATEICEMDLYPNNQNSTAGSAVGDWRNYWDAANAQTGDNARERPYGYIYPRVTTQSNTYTVHIWAQAIRKPHNADPARVDPVRDVVVGEYRGSTTIERFIDPNDPRLAGYEYQGGANGGRLDRAYRFRVLGSRHFVPR